MGIGELNPKDRNREKGMMFLSQYQLSLPEVRALRLTDTYSLHRIVYDLFEDIRGGNTQERSGILFADKGGNARGRRILILSDREPQEPVRGILETRDIAEVYWQFPHYRFEVCINPVRRNNQSGKLLPVCGREAIVQWFLGKAPQWGFSVREDTLCLVDVFVDTFVKSGHPVTLEKATLTGFLDVTDQAIFVQSVCHGLGRARAFGCGLLQIVPAL